MKYASMRATRALLLTTCIALASCGGGQGPEGPRPRRGSSNRITSEELAESVGLDLYTVVQRLRPQWLVVHGGLSTQGRSTIAVFIDGQQQPGSVEILRSMKATDVQELSFMNARDATTRYGTNMGAGAIQITTKH